MAKKRCEPAQKSVFPLAFLTIRRKILTLYMQQNTADTPALIKFQAWFEVNKKRVLIGALIVAVIGLATGFAINYQSQREVRASEALSDIKVPGGPGQIAGSASPDAYIRVAKEHKGTQAAGRALMMAGSTLFAQGQFDDAQKQFEQFTREYPASPFVPEALFGVASCLEAEKKTSDAIAKFEELRRRYAKSSILDETKLSLGRLYENDKKPAQALELYDDLLANPQSSIGSEAGLRREVLLEEHPELKKTNAPPAITATPLQSGTNAIRLLTNRPTITMTNLVRRTSSVPSITLTNRPGSTNLSSPIKLNIITNQPKAQ